MAKEEPTIREQEYINEWYGKKKAKEMAEDLGICLKRKIQPLIDKFKV